MEKFGFFNDVGGDRVYYAEDFARHLARYFTNGIFNNGCQVLANNNDMSINVSIGSANINGYRYDNDAVKKLQLDVADGVLNRIDSVVIRLDLTNRKITAQVIKGTPADTPVAPSIVRDSTIFDLRLATISIPKGTTTITQDLVSDRRFFSDECGDVISTVQTPDTEDLFIQIETAFNNLLASMNSMLAKFNTDSETALSTFDSVYKQFVKDCDDLFTEKVNGYDSTFNLRVSGYDTTFNTKINGYDSTFNSKIEGYDTSFNNKISYWTTDFDTWFANVKGKLDGDVAGNLQNEIDEINNKDLVEDANYVHTDNNFTNDHKKAISDNASSTETNANNIQSLVDNGLKSFNSVLILDNWQLDSTNNCYNYTITNGAITENTSIRICMDRLNQAKFKSYTDVKSYNGYFIISTTEQPEEDISITVKYELANMTLGGGE